MLVVDEGDSVTLCCISMGGPIPSIMWTINNQKTTLNQADIIAESNTTAERTSFFTPGNVTSTVHIVNVQYPTHDGVYTCIGSNSMDRPDKSSSVNITVQVQGKLTR